MYSEKSHTPRINQLLNSGTTHQSLWLLALTILALITSSFWLIASIDQITTAVIIHILIMITLVALVAPLILQRRQHTTPEAKSEYKTHSAPGITDYVPVDQHAQVRSLEILYDVAANINAAKDLNDLLSRFVHILKDIVHADAAAVRLLKDDGFMELVASTGMDPEAVERERRMPSDCSLCGDAIEHGELRVLTDLAPCHRSIGHDILADDSNIEHIAVPLRFQDEIVGVYNLFLDKNNSHSITPEVNNLLTIIGSHLGTAIEKANLEEKARRVLVMHERNMIANELHDSLAQTLASLRFQVRVLDETLQQSGEFQSIHGIEQVEHSLDEAYTDLRELISHCRTPIAEQGVVSAIEKLLSRLRKETDIHVLFQKEWHDKRLPANMEMHIYRIVQEALTNIRKHSYANNVRVLLHNNQKGDYRVLIENDGRGFEQPNSSDHAGQHIGLTIMKERARHLGGELDIESEPDEGTRIELNFHYNDEPIADMQQLIEQSQ